MRTIEEAMPAPALPPSKFHQGLIPLLANPTGLLVDRFLMRYFNYSFMGTMFMRAGGFPVRPHLILRTIHWKTGVAKDAVLPYVADGDNCLVVGSHGGRPKDPVWALNIRRYAEVWICVDKRWHFCQAQVLQNVERERAWLLVNGDGGYGNYTKMAGKHDRQLPVVQIRPVLPAERPLEDKPEEAMA